MILLPLLVVFFAVLAQADVVTGWNALALDAIRSAGTPPPAAARHLAILHAAIYDAVNGIRSTHSPYLVAATGPRGGSVEAAALAAAHAVLTRLYPAHRDTFDAEYQRELALIDPNARRPEAVDWGQSVAVRILQARASDGAGAELPFLPGTEPGQWRPTPSFGGIVRPALAPHWGSVSPFVLATPSQYRPPPPPALDSPSYAADLNLVKALGSKESSVRTPEQTAIARFWSYGPGTATPPGHWNEIAAAVAGKRNGNGAAEANTLEENARLFALLNLALADAAIASWECKYAINYWRPITAIQQADAGNNADTEADPQWEPLLATPPFPEYTSGHSTFSGAAAVVLADFFGTDRVAFEVGSDDLPGMVRRFASFSEAARESGWSRVYGGIHFPSANVHGLSMGAAIGMYVNWTALARIP